MQYFAKNKMLQHNQSRRFYELFGLPDICQFGIFKLLTRRSNDTLPLRVFGPIKKNIVIIKKSFFFFHPSVRFRAAGRSQPPNTQQYKALSLSLDNIITWRWMSYARVDGRIFV